MTIGVLLALVWLAIWIAMSCTAIERLQSRVKVLEDKLR